jgi:RHS repeat-associated protein
VEDRTSVFTSKLQEQVFTALLTKIGSGAAALYGRTETYHYDSTYRLTSAAYGDGTNETFGYDAVGNRLRYTNEATTVSYTFNAANQLLFGSDSDSWTYDGNGNVKQRHDHRGGPDQHQFTYDYNNHLTSYSGSTFEVSRYAPDGQRIRVGGSNVPNQAVMNDTAGNPVATFDSQLQIYRIYGPGMDDILGEYENRQAKRYMHKDALGSITLVTLEDGTVDYRTQYKAFGAATSTGNNDKVGRYSLLGYTARENSVNGMMYYRARHYDTGAGRFIQQDSYPGNGATPPSLHRYSYASGSPLVYVDPTGHDDEYPLSFPSPIYRAWDITYWTVTVSFSLPMAGWLGVGSGIVLWLAHAKDDPSETIGGMAVWVGVTWGHFLVTTTYSNMSGYSPSSMHGNSVFDGDMLYASGGAALVKGWGFTAILLGALSRPPYKGVSTDSVSAMLTDISSLSGGSEYGFDFGVSFGLGYNMGSD